MANSPRPWNANDVPDPPFLHGTSTPYAIGEYLRTETVREDPDPEYNDLREMCFATTSRDQALDWACRTNLEDENRDTLFVYVVELLEPEVDTNVHGLMRYSGHHEEITSVMSRAAA